MSQAPARTTWFATIFGGTLAAVVAGIIVFHYQSWISKSQPVEASKVLTLPQKSDVPPDQRSDAPAEKAQSVKDDGETERAKVAPPCPASFVKRRELIRNIYSTAERDAQYRELVKDALTCADYPSSFSAVGLISSSMLRDEALKDIFDAGLKAKQHDVAEAAAKAVNSSIQRDSLYKRLNAGLR